MSVQPDRQLPVSSDGAAEPTVPLFEVAPSAPARRSGWQDLFWIPVNLLQTLFLAFWSAFCISSAFLVGLITFRRTLPLVMARKMWAPPLIAMTGSRLVLEPLPNIDWSKPHIYLMNHQSMADIPVAFSGLPVNLRFVAKHTLKWVPFIGWYILFTGMILINRSNRREAVKSLNLAGERIRQGSNIIAYPEGTRSRDGRILPFKKGPFMLALAAKVPIVPVAIDGTGEVLPRGGVRFRPRTVRMKIGEPIETAHLTHADRDDLMRRARDEMIRLHREIGGKGGVPEAIAAEGVEGK